jgi:hypothetical protein
MTRPGQAGVSSGPPVAYYAEDHCALRWPFLAAGLYVPLAVLALAVLAGVLPKLELIWVLLLLFVGIPLATVWAARGQLLPYAWPAGIRLDADGVRIGGVRWAEKHPGRARRKPTVPHQYGQVFSCPWDGVQRIGVTRNHEAIKVMIRHAYYGRKPTPLGNLAVPFMRAALVIWVEQEHAAVPEIRPARGPLSVNWSSPGYHQPIWVIPTRHPGQLETALATLPLPAGTIGDPYAGASPDITVAEWSNP